MSTDPTHAAQPLHDALAISGDALVATVGAGGKTTLLFALAAERAHPNAQPGRSGLAVCTTTTKFTIPSGARDLPLMLGANPASRAAAIQDAWRHDHPAIIVGSARGQRGRVLAVEPDWPAQALALPGVGLVCVEADGAAGRGFKAPADHEPVMPAGVTHVLACVSVTALGKPLNDKAVHRPERVASLTCTPPEDPVTPEIIAAVLTHDEGGRKAVPPGAAFAIVVTSAARDPAGAAAIARACRDASIDRILAFDAQTSSIDVL